MRVRIKETIVRYIECESPDEHAALSLAAVYPRKHDAVGEVRYVEEGEPSYVIEAINGVRPKACG